MVDLKPSKGRTIVIDKKTGNPRAPNKTPKHFAQAKRSKASRAEKAWKKAQHK